MNLSADEVISWPEASMAIALLIGILFLIGFGLASWLEFRKLKVNEAQSTELRQLVRRYEQLAEATMDAQQRVAADVADLRTRTTSIEQLLRTVD